jgi:hypothetical protein
LKNLNFWYGIVESRDDPQQLGRVQVRIFGAHSESLDDVPTSSLPWAICLQGADSASMSGIGKSAVGYLPGSLVYGYFLDGKFSQNPVVLGSSHGIPFSKTPFSPTKSNEFYDSQLVLSNGAVTNTPDATLNETNPVRTEPSTEVVATGDADTKLKTALGQRESNNNYKAVNKLGYIGKYQMGASMLTDLGYVKRGTTNKQLDNPDVWTGKNGVVSKESFLENSEAQERAMDEELTLNSKRLTKMGVIDSTTTDQERAGFLATSHLLGTGGARDMKQGVVKTDANGITGNEYYKLGYTSVAGIAPTIAPDAVTPDNPARTASPLSSIGSVTSTTTPSGFGFSDPSGKYPIYTHEQDTNRLARNQNIEKTIVAYKDATRELNVRGAHGTQWEQSVNPYNAKYPYNYVYETESGHIFEIDNTPKNERIHQFHASGTFSEVDRNGTRVNKIVGDDFEIIERNGHVLIKGNLSISVHGDANILVENNCNLEVDGNFDARVGGDATWAVGGDIKMKSNNFHVSASEVALDYDSMWMDSGKSTAGSLTTPTASASGGVSLPTLTLEPREFAVLADFESDDATEEEIASHREQMKSAGILDDSPTDATIKEGETVPQNYNDSIVVECGMFESGKINIQSYISDNYRLSDLTKGSNIVSQGGLTDTAIACNLKAVAINILEKIKVKYPDVKITSGYRKYLNNPRSQHPLGMAVDLQFPGANYYEIAKDLAATLVFDQLILEFESSRRIDGKPVTWIHISFNQNGNRRQVFTMNNSQRISEFGVLKEVS